MSPSCVSATSSFGMRRDAPAQRLQRRYDGRGRAALDGVLRTLPLRRRGALRGAALPNTDPVTPNPTATRYAIVQRKIAPITTTIGT